MENNNNTHHNALGINNILDGKYELIKVLGSGGFGITYLANFQKLNSKVVIKEYFPTDLAHRDENSTIVPLNTNASDFYFKGKERFLFEAQTIAKFKHPYIVRIIDYFETNNTAYFVMDYEEGEDLGVWLEKHKKITQEEILPIIVPILDALTEIHTQNIYHRDIKPDNIYMRTNGAPMLIDFGAAKESFQNGSKASSFNPRTASYAAPEQKSSMSKYIGAYTDIYAIGAVIHKMVTGKTPPTADDRSISRDNEGVDCYVSLAEQKIKGFSKEFLKNIDWALSFLSKDRPQSAKELQSALMKQETKEVKKEEKSQEVKKETEIVKPIKKREIQEENKSKNKNILIASIAVGVVLVSLLMFNTMSANSNEQNNKIEKLQQEVKEKERKATLTAQELLDKRKEEETRLALERQKEREQKEKAEIEERIALERQKEREQKEKAEIEERIALEKQQAEARRAEEKRVALEKQKEEAKIKNIFYDNSTGLTWQDDIDAKTVEKDWLGAKEYCSDLSLNGYNWHLPSKEQLNDLYTKKDKLKNVSDLYWSSSETDYSVSSACNVSFNNGAMLYFYNKSNKFYVRCVRDMKTISLENLDSQIKDKSIYFEYKSNECSLSELKKIEQVAKLYKKLNGDFILKLEGNTDERGSDEANFKIGLNRAIYVKKVLVEVHGIDESSIITLSYGESNPVCTEKTKDCWQQNGRVEFKFLP